jgi:hypothetical protein
MEEWIGASEEFENQAWWACLNDATLFNFGFDWQRVYDIMPEVAGPVSGAGYKRYPSPEIVEMSRTQFRASFRKTKQQEPDRWREDPHRFIELEAADLLRTVAAAYILVADHKAFETGGQVRLVYVDGKRNTPTRLGFQTPPMHRSIPPSSCRPPGYSTSGERSVWHCRILIFAMLSGAVRPTARDGESCRSPPQWACVTVVRRS